MPNSRSDPPQRLGKLSILGFVALFAMQGCATVPTSPTIPVPSTFRESCRQPTSKLETLGDLGALAVRLREALQDCDARRKGLVETIDGYQAAVAPKKRFGLF